MQGQTDATIAGRTEHSRNVRIISHEIGWSVAPDTDVKNGGEAAQVYEELSTPPPPCRYPNSPETGGVLGRAPPIGNNPGVDDLCA